MRQEYINMKMKQFPWLLPGHHYKEISIVVYLLYFQSGIIISLSELIFDLRINVVDIRKRDKNNKKNH